VRAREEEGDKLDPPSMKRTVANIATRLRNARWASIPEIKQTILRAAI